jgi:thiamine pyrophosphate-dependent acetolactate synthase large subunit-like protein
VKLHDALAHAFIAEGTDTLFTLMGDANMHWSIAMAQREVRLVHARHENAAVAMAEGYARAGRTVGVASVTSGPGTTPIMTSLVAAVRGRVPLVVAAGSTPLAANYHLQQVDVAGLVRATGAEYLEVRDVDNALGVVQIAFTTARQRKVPVVIGVPHDLQDADYPWELFYRSSRESVVRAQRVHPDPLVVAEAVELIMEAERPVIIAGRGAVESGARGALLDLAQSTGALVATSLKAKGWFEGDPFDLGIAGAFTSTTARTYFADADLVIGAGAGLGHFTTEAGYLYPNARVVQIDVDPRPLHEDVPAADLYVIADVQAAASALVAQLKERGHQPSAWRGDEVRTALAGATTSEPPVELAPGTVHPRDALRAIDAAIPRDWLVVIGAGHMWNFAVEHLSGREPENYLFTIDFGPVGQAIGVAIGAALARPDTGVALIDGDGGIMMQVQELETMHRHGIPVVTFVLNDGAFGAEVHKLVARGLDPSEAIFGAPDLAAIAEALGVPGTHVGADTDLGAAFGGIDGPTLHLFDVHISPNVPSAQFRRLHFGESP